MKYESTRIKVLALCQQTLCNKYIFRSILAKEEDYWINCKIFF